MGARKEDYVRSARHKSFIHVDDFESPEALAKYLHQLDRDDELYNEYFQWTADFTVYQDVNRVFCQICEMLNSIT